MAGVLVALAAAPALADGGTGIGGAPELNYGVIKDDIAALASLATIAAGAIGFGLLGFGLLSFIKKTGQQAPLGRSLAMILVGGVLISVMAAADMASNSIFGSDNLTLVGIESVVSDNAGPAKPMFDLLFRIGWIVGFLGFISGWIGLTKQQLELYGSIARILGGAVAMNAKMLLLAVSQWGGIFSGIGKFIQ